MVALAVAVPQACGCRRSDDHLHYSSSHDLLLKSALAFILLAEGISFIQGSVKGLTTLYLESWEIKRYQVVAEKIAELTAPYEHLKFVALATELIVLLFVIVAVLTLHSIENRGTHTLLLAGGVTLLIIGIIMRGYYVSATDAALTRLPSLVDGFVLKTALEVEQRFLRAYGFWGSPAPGAINAIFSIAGLVFLVAALITSRHFRVWQGAPTPEVTALGQPEIPPATTEILRERRFCESCGSQMPVLAAICPTCGHRSSTEPLVPQPRPTKFCRYCGAKIPRESGKRTDLTSLHDVTRLQELAERLGLDRPLSSKKAPPGVAVSPKTSDTTEKLFCMNCGREMRYSWPAKKWICDDCQISTDAPPPPPPPKHETKFMFSGVASAMAVFGFVAFGGVSPVGRLKSPRRSFDVVGRHVLKYCGNAYCENWCGDSTRRKGPFWL